MSPWTTGYIRRFLLETITSRPPVGMAAVEGRCLGYVYVRSPRVAVHTFGLGHCREVELRDVKGCKGSGPIVLSSQAMKHETTQFAASNF